MSRIFDKSSRSAWSFAALGAIVTVVMHAQVAAAEDAEDPGQEEGRIVTISPEVVEGEIGEDRDSQALIAGEDAARAQTEKLNGLLRASASLEDLGVKLRWLDAARGLALESESGMVGDGLA